MESEDCQIRSGSGNMNNNDFGEEEELKVLLGRKMIMMTLRRKWK